MCFGLHSGIYYYMLVLSFWNWIQPRGNFSAFGASLDPFHILQVWDADLWLALSGLWASIFPGDQQAFTHV